MYSPAVRVRNRTMVKPLEVAVTRVAEGGRGRVEENPEVIMKITEEIKMKKKRLKIQTPLKSINDANPTNQEKYSRERGHRNAKMSKTKRQMSSRGGATSRKQVAGHIMSRPVRTQSKRETDSVRRGKSRLPLNVCILHK